MHEKGRQSLTITIQQVTPESVGQLIALFERSVGFYASLININAYHQPGVEAGKKAAADIIDLEKNLLQKLRESDKALSVEELSIKLGLEPQKELIFKLLNRLIFNKKGVHINLNNSIEDTTYCIK